MTDKEKAKKFVDRIAEINVQVQSGDVNFEQARVTIDTYKWLASKYDPSTYGNQPQDSQQLDINQMHLDAIKELSKPG